MLYLMRRHAGSWMIKILLGAIVAVFVLWGGGSFNEDRNEAVAVVNDEPVSQEEYERVYGRLLDGVRRSYGGALNDDILKILGLKRRAVESLIDKKLLLQEAAKLNVRVSDRDLAASILRMPAFHRDGVFDSRRYSSILNRSRMTPAGFEQGLRLDIMAEMMRGLVISSARISDMEARDLNQWEGETRNIEFWLSAPGDQKKIAVSKEEIQAFFEENKDRHKTEPEMSVSYIHFSPDAFERDAAVDEDEIRDVFDSMKKEEGASYDREKKGIRKRLVEEKARDLACDRAEEAYQDAFDLDDLGKIARDADMKVSATGFFTRQSTVIKGIAKPGRFISAAFALSADEVGEPLDAGDGCYLIQARERKPSRIPDLADVEKKVKADLEKKKRDEAAQKEAEARLAALKDGKKEAGARTTGFFGRRDEIPGIGRNGEILGAAFGLSEETPLPDRVFKTPKGYVAIRLKETRAPDPDEFEAGKEAFKKAALQDKQLRLFSSWLDDVKMRSEISRNEKYLD